MSGIQHIATMNSYGTISDEEFYVNSNTGKIDYLKLKKYVKREDGKIEIQEVNNYRLGEKNNIIEL